MRIGARRTAQSSAVATSRQADESAASLAKRELNRSALALADASWASPPRCCDMSRSGAVSEAFIDRGDCDVPPNSRLLQLLHAGWVTGLSLRLWSLLCRARDRSTLDGRARAWSAIRVLASRPVRPDSSGCLAWPASDRSLGDGTASFPMSRIAGSIGRLRSVSRSCAICRPRSASRSPSRSAYSARQAPLERHLDMPSVRNHWAEVRYRRWSAC